ncbi:MAG: hypothetical protein JWN86_3994 [Planctomycetota bacterium]|nr:hypothetical protein [Planctomycetota bacterium]
MSISYPSDVTDFDDLPPPDQVRDGIDYPDSDGEEMGESDWHLVAMTTLFSMLRERYRARDVYVAADMMFYYEEGNPSAVRSPDCMVVFGVPNHARASWLAWEEKALPAVVFEIASGRTFRDDLRAKRDLYERLGIPEYILFDPVGLYLRDRRLRGFRLREGSYAEIELDDEGGLVSEQLGLMIYPEGEILRLVDMETRRYLRTGEESSRLYERERERFALLKRAARAARRRAVRAFKAEQQKADAERQKADAERQKADAERQRGDELAAEVERLRAMLAAKPDGGRNP